MRYTSEKKQSPLQITIGAIFTVTPTIAIFQVIAAALGIGLLSYEPILIKSLFDSIENERKYFVAKEFIKSEIFYNFILVSSVWILAFIVNIIQEIIERALAPAAQKEVQNKLFQYAISQSPTHLTNTSVGFITQSIKQAGAAVSILITLLTYDFVRLFIMTGMMLYVSTKLPPVFLLIVFSWTIAYYTICYWFAKKTFPKFKMFSNVGAKSAGTISDILNNVDLVRSFSKTKDEIHVVNCELNLEKEASEENRKYIILMNLIVYGGAILFQSIFVFYSIFLLNKGMLSLGEVALAISLAAILVNNASGLCRQLLSFFEQTGYLSNAIEAIGNFEIIETSGHAPNKKIKSGKIDFQNVTFQYDNAKLIFQDLNLQISHGEKIGIVGNSGAGKTTFIKLLTKRYKPSTGIIKIDDVSTLEISEEYINQNISQVSQDILFLNRTLAENISYGCESVTQNELLDVLKKTQSIEFLSKLALGLDSTLSQKNDQISGGEKQRLALARALLKKAYIIVLDEATSAIDVETEHLILDELSSTFNNKTIIIVSHRISTLKNVDRIIFIQDQAQVFIGRHDELVASNKSYLNWMKSQSM
jgi:ATP-binding cassette, subfamily B, bacterial